MFITIDTFLICFDLFCLLSAYHSDYVSLQNPIQ